MALTPTLTFCLNNSCADLTVSETTGTYSTSNTGGYNSPNPQTISATSYVLTITDPNGDTYTVDLFATTLFPTEDDSIEYTIAASTIGGRTVFEDGLWQFSWTIAGNLPADPEPIPYSYTGNSASYFTCNSECCVSELLAKVNLDDCCCDSSNDYVEDYLKAKVLLAGLKNAAFCGKTSYFTKIKNTLNKICSKTSCKTCN